MNKITGYGNVKVKINKHLSYCQFSAIRATKEEPYKLDKNDTGKLYSIPLTDVEQLGFGYLYLPKHFRRQIQTFGECVWMFRKQTLQAFESLRNLETGQTAPRIVLWGKYGTGKSMTLYQLLHLAYTQGYILVTIPDAMAWSYDNYNEVQISTFKQGRINSPYWASKILKSFKWQNRHQWDKISKLNATKTYQWSQVERTNEGKPITEIVEMGISAPYLATDCVGGLFKELRIHATSGEAKILVAIDKANGLYGKTVVKKPDRTLASPDEVSLTVHTKKFLMPVWSNGLCAMVADKAGISDSRDTLSVPVNDPASLFGDEGYEQIQPFISVETSLYSDEELDVMHEYYLEKNWIRQEEGPNGEEARRQLKYLSAFNPAYFERICAMSWNLNSVPPLPFSTY